MRQTYEKLIEEVDGTIHILRDFWLTAKGTEKERQMERINGLLDERLRLMALRDAEPV